MEHPVPQNITSFEFHLVGDMTLKQFVYLAVGLGLAYLTFAGLFSRLPVVAIPLIVIFAILGIAFAFLPILDRPLDHWVLAFFKAAYSPTQGFWKEPGAKKVQKNISSPLLKNRLQRYLATKEEKQLSIPPVQFVPPQAPAPTPIKPTPTPIKPTPTPQPTPSPVLAPQPIPPTPPILPNKELTTLAGMAKEAQILQGQITKTGADIEHLEQAAAKPHLETGQHAEQINQASANLQRIVQQTKQLYQATSQVISVEPPKEPRIQIQLTTFPNVINGIVIGLDGNYLEGVIITVHNKDGIPVRALKTNKLGQFTGATPLPPGIYNVTFEKEGLNFDTLQINLNNEVLRVLSVKPKRI